jgi:lipoprotein-releasing system permease protein
LNRTLIWQLALRYLRGKRTANVVPILSRISMVAVAVTSAAMIVIFSVFNGMETVVKDLYKAFYPDLKVTVARGKFFEVDAAKVAAIKKIQGVKQVTTVIEDDALASNNDEQKVVTLRGIDKDYFGVNDIREDIKDGDKTVSIHPNTAIAGLRILNELGADVHNIFSEVELYYANPEATNPEADPTSAYKSLTLHPAGMFSIQDEFDSKYILAALPLVQELFHQDGRISSVEISTEPGKAEDIRKQVQQLYGANFKVETRYEQNKTIYMVMSGEKWAIYVILVFVLLIASFNMVGALSMLVLEKQRDIAILKAMGALPGTIKKVFLLEAVLWSLVGGLAGIAVGTTLALLQQHFSLVKLSGNFLLNAYPVEFSPADILLVITTNICVGLLAGWYPAIRSTRVIDPTLKAS